MTESKPPYDAGKVKMKPYHRNPRQITKKRFTRLQDTLSRLGDLGGIVHNLNTDEIIGGNQRMAVFQNGESEIVETLSEPDEQGTVAHGFIVWQGKKYAYRQVRWDEQTAAEANIAANVGAGSWDWDVFANQWDAGSLQEWGMDAETLREWRMDAGALSNMLEAAKPHADAEPQIDRAAELLEKWQVKIGDLWRIGEHRLLCGDSTKRENVERVMEGEKANLLFTSPPYWIGKEYETQICEKEIDEFIASCVMSWTDFVNVDYGRVCINTGSAAIHRVEKGRRVEVLPLIDKWQAQLKQRGWLARHWRIWAKGGDFPAIISARVDVVDQHWEHIVTFDSEYSFLGTWWSPAGEQRGQEKIGMPWAQQGIWSDIQGDRSAEGHIAAFPLELPARNIRLYSQEEEDILEPFSGSGTTLVACQNLSRKCRAIEISPAYCAVTLERMATAFPGIEIERLSSNTG